MSRAQKYAKITSLAEIAAEKRELKKMIAGKERVIKADWQNIREAWSFIPKIKKGFNFVTNILPVGIGAVSFLTKILKK